MLSIDISISWFMWKRFMEKCRKSFRHFHLYIFYLPLSHRPIRNRIILFSRWQCHTISSYFNQKSLPHRPNGTVERFLLTWYLTDVTGKWSFTSTWKMYAYENVGRGMRKKEPWIVISSGILHISTLYHCYFLSLMPSSTLADIVFRSNANIWIERLQFKWK